MAEISSGLYLSLHLLVHFLVKEFDDALVSKCWSILFLQAQLLGQDDEHEIPDVDGSESSEFESADTPAANIGDDARRVSGDEMRKML